MGMVLLPNDEQKPGLLPRKGGKAHLLHLCFFSLFYLFYVYDYTVAVLMVVSHHVVAGNLNSGPLLALVSPALSDPTHSGPKIYLLLYLSTL